MLQFFAPCPRGLEETLAAELGELGIPASAATVGSGGVHFAGDLALAYRANYESRIASRILMRVSKARYRSVEDIYAQAKAVAWWQWFTPEETLRIDTTASRSPLKSIDFATLRIKDGVCDAFRDKTKRRPSIDTQAPQVRIFAFVDANECTLYLDTTGEALFRRGWRHDRVDAPLRENLAAGILRMAGWQPGRALLDPMCGSGTFVIEAAQMCLNVPPGAKRHFGFQALKNFDAAAWHAITAAPRPPREGLDLLHASDISGDAVLATRANLDSAGIDVEVAGAIAPKQIDARHIRPDAAGGLLVANPPYGERIGIRGADDDAQFFAEFGDNLKARFAGWDCAILTNDMALQRKIHLAPRLRTPLFNGAIECRLYQFRMVAGSTRAKVERDPS